MAERAAGAGVHLGGGRPAAKLLAARRGRAGGGVGELVALVRPGGRKLIWSEDAPDELYLLGEDPAERSNAWDESDELAQALASWVERWREATVARGSGPRVAEDPETREMLDDLGY